MNCDTLTYFMFAGHIKFIAITLERDGVIYWNLIVERELLQEVLTEFSMRLC